MVDLMSNLSGILAETYWVLFAGITELELYYHK